MIILTIRTDKPESEIGLFDNETKLAYETWEAHRHLAETIHSKIKQLLDAQHLGWEDISGIVVYKGPGSFTGLRIGISVANALAYSYGLAISGSTGEDWAKTGIAALINGKAKRSVLPEYGGDVHTTLPTK